MRVLSRADFLKTIEAVGVRLDSKYPKSAILGFPNKPDVARFWAVPGEPQTIPHFAATMINLLGPWKSIFVWKHLGSWMVEVKGEDLNDDIQALLYKGLGIQSNSADTCYQHIRNQRRHSIGGAVDGKSAGADVGYAIPSRIGRAWPRRTGHIDPDAVGGR